MTEVFLQPLFICKNVEEEKKRIPNASMPKIP